MALRAKTYAIKNGDTLSGIAQAHGLPGWQAIYFAPCNRQFREKHGDPNKIPTGARLLIPEDLQEQRQAMQTRIKHLRAIRKDAVALKDEQVRVLDASLKKLDDVSDGVDTAAAVGTMMVGLVSLTMEAFQIMKLSGDALKTANKKFMIGKLADTGMTLADASAQAIAQQKVEAPSTVWLVTKSVAQAWCDMSSPSFWANTAHNLWYEDKTWSEAVNERPEDLYRKTKQKLEQASAGVIRNLDEKIREAEMELKMVGSRTGRRPQARPATPQRP